MSNPSTAAATARQSLASVLGSLQQDPNCPPGVLEIVGGLAKAMGPLFQLERGSSDLQLFVQARSVLQQTLEKIQTVDQNYPGVQKVLLGDPGAVVRLPTSPGTLAVFRGQHALHRVTPVSGPRPRINSVLTYGERPGMKLKPLTQELFYGRTA